jgi:vitamin B12 transporter
MKKILTTGILCLLSHFVIAETIDSVRQYNLEEVIVTSARMNIRLREMPQKVEIIDQTIINSLPSENLAEIMKRTTNLDVVQYGGLFTTIGMRGFSPSAHSRSYTLLLINGKPSGTVNLATVSTANIDRIEIVKGPYSTLYGSDAMGGIINIITKSADSIVKGDVCIEAGSFGTLRLKGEVSGPIGERANFILGYYRDEQQKDYRIGGQNLLHLTDEEKSILVRTSYNDLMRNTGYQVNHANAGFAYRISRKWKIETDAMYSTADDIETPGNYWGTYGSNKRDFDRLNIYGNLSRNSGSNTLSLNPYFTNEKNFDYSNDSDTGFVNFISDIRQYGIKMQENIELGKIDILFGTDLDNYNYRSDRFSFKATPAAPYSPDYWNTKSAVFAQIAYKAENLFVNAGARYDLVYYFIEEDELINASGGKDIYHAFNPSAGIQYSFPFDLKIHGSFGTAYSVPDAFKVAGFYSVSEYFPEWDFWWVSNYKGNPDLKPESSVSADLGLRYDLMERLFYIDLTWFQTYHKDKIIEYAIGGDTMTFRNANNSIMNGIELMVSTDIGKLFSKRFKLELYANYTYNIRNTVDETLTSLITGTDSIVTRDMLYTRKSLGNFGVCFDDFRGFSTRLNARYSGSRLEYDNFSQLRPEITGTDYYTAGGYTQNEKILKIPDFLILDFSVYYSLGGNKRFGICISNLLDENYNEKDGYHMPGRMISGSFSYIF